MNVKINKIIKKRKLTTWSLEHPAHCTNIFERTMPNSLFILKTWIHNKRYHNTDTDADTDRNEHSVR